MGPKTKIKNQGLFVLLKFLYLKKNKKYVFEKIIHFSNFSVNF